MNPNVTWTTSTNDIDKAPHIYAYTDKNMNDKNMPSTFTNNMLLEKPQDSVKVAS